MYSIVLISFLASGTGLNHTNVGTGFNPVRATFDRTHCSAFRLTSLVKACTIRKAGFSPVARRILRTTVFRLEGRISMNISELMVTLHRYHRQLTELRYRLKKGEQLIEYNKTRLGTAQQELEKRTAEQTRMRLAAKENETRLKTFEEGLKKRRTQLGEAKTNKEHQALKDQIEQDEKTGSTLADEVLAALDEVDKFTPTVDEARKEVERLEKLIAEAQTEYDQERPVIEADIVTYSGRLAKQEEDLPLPFEEPYRRLVEKLGGEEAMAPIVNGNYCGHCNTLIPIHFVADICNGRPFTCQACGRLLYVPEDYVIH